MFGRLLSVVEAPFANGAIKRHAMKSNAERDAFIPKQAFGNFRYGLFVEKVIGWMVIFEKDRSPMSFHFHALKFESSAQMRGRFAENSISKTRRVVNFGSVPQSECCSRGSFLQDCSGTSADAV